MSELSELYQEVLLDHNRNPRNFKAIEDATAQVEGFNPLCGDKIQIFLKLKDDVVEDVGFKGSGCAISKASASLMTAEIKGKKIEEVEQLFDRIHRLFIGQSEWSANDETLGKLVALSGVSDFPMRVKCATLAWHTMRAALRGQSEPVTTE